MGRFKFYNFDPFEAQILDTEVVLPEPATVFSSGYDIKSVVDRTLYPGKVTMIPTGLCCELDYNEELQIRCRSGLASKGIMLANGVGTIDADYEGQIMILLYNSTDKPYEIKAGDRIAQGVFANYNLASNDPRNSLWYDLKMGRTTKDEIKSQRGKGGFGSTGV